jgi:hypothetical protein
MSHNLANAGYRLESFPVAPKNAAKFLTAATIYSGQERWMLYSSSQRGFSISRPLDDFINRSAFCGMIYKDRLKDPHGL